MGAILQELIYDALFDGAVWPFDRRYIRPPHFHGQIELLVIRRGTATLHLGARAETVRADHLCWILPGVSHVMSDFSNDFDLWVVELDAALVGACWRHVLAAPRETTPGAFEGWVTSLGERLAGRTTVDIGSEDARRLGELASEVWTSASAAVTRRVLRTLAELALRITLASLDGRPETSVADLASCLMLASPLLDRSSVASELGISEGFLSRSFSRELGVTFVEHRARTRVAHFLALTQGGRRTLLDAALEAGFGSYSQFHRIFTRVSGSPPRDYLGGGRHRRQLLVAGDSAQPQAGPARALPSGERQKALLDA